MLASYSYESFEPVKILYIIFLNYDCKFWCVEFGINILIHYNYVLEIVECTTLGFCLLNVIELFPGIKYKF